MLIESFIAHDVGTGDTVEVYSKEKIDTLLVLIMSNMDSERTTPEIRKSVKLIIEASVGIKEA